MDTKFEFLQCKVNFRHFCENYIKLNHPKNGLIDFKMHDYQKRYAKFLKNHDYVIATKFRQGGFTTIDAAYCLWRLIFKRNDKTVIVAKQDREAVDICKMINHFISHLPDFLKPAIEDSSYYFLATETNKLHFRTPASLIGLQIDNCFIQEAAYIDGLERYWSIHLLQNCKRVVVTSTPDGDNNWFAKTYFDALEDKNPFSVYHCRYDEHPEYRKKEWVKDMQSALGSKLWQQEVLQQFYVI